MPEPITVGRIEVPVHANTRVFEREIKQDLKQRANRAGREAADGIVDAATRRFRTRQADLREAFARGLIGRREFERRGAEAAEAFNKELLTGIESLAKSGRLRHRDFLRLSESLKDEGIEAGKALTDGFEEGSRGLPGVLGKLGTAVKAFLGFFIVREAIQGIRRLLDFLRGTAADAEALAVSYLRLQATAKLFNIEQRDLVDLATRARTEFNLTATAANAISTQVAKLAAIADRASQSQQLLNAALDLGAAQGMDAAATAEALEQTLRGLDEGTDRLLQKNPSQIYAEWAAQSGRTAASLTDVEQKQALLNAVLTAGARIQGEYQRFLRTSVGAQTEWRNQLQTIREEIGKRVIPVTNRLMLALSPALADAARTVTGLLERMLSPTQRLQLRFEQLGIAAETALPLLLRERIEEARDDLKRLETEATRARVAFDRLRARPEGPTGGGGLEGQPLPRDLAGLRVAETEAEAEFTRLAAEGEKEAADAALKRFDAIRRVRETEEAILRTRREVSQIERQLPELERRARLRADIADLEAEIVKLDATAEREGENAGIAALRRTLEARKRGIEVALGLIKEPTEEGPVAPDPAALEAAKKLAQQREAIERDLADRVFAITHDLAEQTIRDIDRIGEAYVEAGGNLENIAAQLEALKDDVRVGTALSSFREELERLQRLDPTPAIISGLESLRDRLMAARDELEVGSRRWQEYDAEISKVFATLESIRPEALLSDVQGAFDRRMLELQELFARGLINEQQFTEQGEKAAAAFHAAVLAYIKKLRDSGELSEELYQALIAALPKVPKALDDAVSNSVRLARQIDEAATGALKLAEAFGVVDSSTAASLQNLIEMASAVPGIVQALQAGGGGLSAALPGIGAIAGGLATIVSGLLAESPEERERAERFKENSQRLRELTAGIAKLDQSLAGISGQSFVGVGKAIGETLTAGPFLFDEQRAARFRAELALLGLTMEDAEEIARALGIEFDGSKESMEQLQEAIGLFEFERLFETLSGQLSLLQQEFEIMNIDDPIEQLRRFLNVIHQFAGAEIDPPVWNLDSEEGRQLARNWVQNMFQLLRSNEITPEQLGGLSLDEFRDFLSEFNRRLEEAGREAEGRFSFDFLETFAGQLNLLRQAFEIFDIDDPIQQLERILAVFNEFAGVDPLTFALDTETGRSAAREWVQQMFQLIQSGGLTSAQLGKLSVDEFSGFLQELNRRLEEASEVPEEELGFLDTFAGRLSLLRQEFEIFDLDDPIEQLQRILDIFDEFSGVDPPAFALDTEAGRSAAREWVQEMFRLIQAGGLTTQLGALSPDEFRNLLQELNRRLEDIGEETGGIVGGPEQTRLAVNITQAQANQLISLDLTRNRYLAQLVELMGGKVNISTSLALPSSRSLGLTGGGGVGPFTFGDINVEIPIQTTGNVDPATLEEGGRLAGQAFGTEFNRVLSERHRGQGGHGSPRIVTTNVTR